MLSFWYRQPITLVVAGTVYKYTATLFRLFAHSQWILHNCSSNLRILQYEDLISWLSLYLVVSIFVFMLCILSPLTLLWVCLGVGCLALHILMYQMAAFVFSNFSFVFDRCYTFLLVGLLLLWCMHCASCAAGYPDQQMHYTGCNRRNGPDFGRVFLMLNYTEKPPQKTYIQSWTVSEIMASEVWNFDSCYTLTDYQIHIETGRNMWFL